MSDAERLARIWIDGWDSGDPSGIPLAEGFVHESPFGRIEGRAAYLDFMQPMMGGKGPALRIQRTLAVDDECAIWFEMEAPGGMLPACDWVTVADGQILAIRSFYDATTLR